LLSFRNQEDIIFGDELKLIASRHNNIKVIITLTSETPEHVSWTGLTGRITKKKLAQQVPELQERTVFLCGPDAFISMCKEKLLKLNVPSENLVFESFSDNSPISKPMNDPQRTSLRTKTGNYRVEFAKSGKTINTDGQSTVLEHRMPRPYDQSRVPFRPLWRMHD
jgi:ferredoxin-NADP reductase